MAESGSPKGRFVLKTESTPGLKPALFSILRNGNGHLVAAFFVGWVFMYTDRAVFSPVLGEIGTEFNVSPSRLGLIGSSFYLAYAVFQIPVGLAAETFGRKRLLIAGFILFGVSTSLSGLAPIFPILIMLAFVTGAGQATYYPIQYSIAAETMPIPSRTLSLALINTGMAVGVGGGILIASFVAFGLGLGWRLSLIGMGLLTVLVALWLSKVVPAAPRVTSESRPARESFRQVLHRDQIAAYVANFCSLYGFFALLTWLPFYLERSRGLSEFSAGAVSTVAAWASIPAALLAAYISDTIRTHRRIVLLMLPIAAGAITLLPFVAMPAVIALLVIYGASGKLASDPLLIAYLADRTRSGLYPLTYGVFNFSGMLGAIVAPATTGVILQLSGDMMLGFLVAAMLLLIGCFFLWILGSEASDTDRLLAHSPTGLRPSEMEPKD